MKIRYTVPSEVSRAAYTGNGVTQVFPVSFNFFEDSDLEVTLIVAATGLETTQVLTTNYTVTGGEGGSGSITMLTAPPVGTTLVIERDIPYTQEIDLEPNDPFPAEVTEEGFDRATMLAQQNRNEIAKSPKLPPTYDPDSDPEIRIPVPVAGKVLIGNADEDGWDNAAIEDLDITDIPSAIVSVVNRDMLRYDSTGGVWRNEPPVEFTILDYIISGATPATYNAALVAMAADKGIVVIPEGDYPLDTMTIDVPLYFQFGGAVSSNTGQTVTIRNRVNAPKQYIFKGAGSYSFEHNPGVQGEDARQAHVSWFGAFPTDTTGNVSPALQKLTDSMGNTREAGVQFDIGAYYCRSTVTWNRGSKVRGAGRRLTSIGCSGGIATTGNLFTTAGTGCEFSDFQPSVTGSNIRTSGAYVNLAHTTCRAERLMIIGGFHGVSLGANECEAHDIRGFVGFGIAAGSRLVSVAASRCKISKIHYSSAATGPDYVVAVEGATANCFNNIIDDVYVDASSGSHGVGLLNGSTFHCSSSKVTNVYMEDGGYGVVLNNTGSQDATGFYLNGIHAGGASAGILSISLTSTGDIRELSTDHLTATVCDDDAIAANATSTGFIQGWTIGEHMIRNAAGHGIQIAAGASDVAIQPGVVMDCDGDGYNITAINFTLNGVVSRLNTGTGIILNSGCDHFNVTGVVTRSNTAANLTDNSGAVTKNLTGNITVT